MKEYLKKNLEFYECHVEEYIKNTTGLQDNDWLNKFISFLPKKSKILDLGCGWGQDSKFFIEHDFETVGVDFSSQMIKKARDLVKKAKFYQREVGDLNFPNGTFNGIWCSFILLHVSKKDTKKVLGSIRKILKKEGILYLALKKGKGEGFKKDERYGREVKFESYYTKAEIKKLLGNVGFRLLALAIKKASGYRKTDTIHLLAKK